MICTHCGIKFKAHDALWFFITDDPRTTHAGGPDSEPYCSGDCARAESVLRDNRPAENEAHVLDDAEWRCSCGEECWTPEAFVLHLAEVMMDGADRAE